MKIFIDIMKKILNYSVKISLLLLSTLIIISIIFIGNRYLKIKSYESQKVFEKETQYFNVNLSTSFRPNYFEDYFVGDGQIYYKLHLNGYLDKYTYDKYEIDDQISILFLDEYGFKLFEENFYFKGFTKLMDEDRIVGFERLDSFDEDFRDYKKIESIRVTWSCNFEKK